MSPLRTLFYMTLLTLPALPAARRRDDPHRPKIVATTASKRSERLPYGKGLLISYTEDLTINILCSSGIGYTQQETRNLTIYQEIPEIRQLHAERLNSTTIQATLIKPKVAGYGYSCTDSFIKSYNTVEVRVMPAMSVEARGLRHTQNISIIGSNSVYFVPRGNAYNISCSAHDANLISLTMYSTEMMIKKYEMSTQTVNDTTVIATVTNHTDGFRQFTCDAQYIRSAIEILTDYYPEATEFKCVIYYLSMSLECTWRSSSKRNTFKLFINMLYGNALLCTDSSETITAGCKKSLFDKDIRVLTRHPTNPRIRNHRVLLNGFAVDGTNNCNLEICNPVFCTNQLFSVNILYIVKLEPVYDLEINTSAHSATIAWRQEFGYETTAHKVEYRLLGTEWRQVNPSAVRCENPWDTGECMLQLALPCPDAHYELLVYVKYKYEFESIYWSEPASGYFFTAETASEVDPACDRDFTEKPPPPSATLVLYEVRHLISNVSKEKKALKRKIVGLKEKLAEVKALLASRAESHAGGREKERGATLAAPIL